RDLRVLLPLAAGRREHRAYGGGRVLGGLVRGLGARAGRPGHRLQRVQQGGDGVRGAIERLGPVDQHGFTRVRRQRGGEGLDLHPAGAVGKFDLQPTAFVRQAGQVELLAVQQQFHQREDGDALAAPQGGVNPGLHRFGLGPPPLGADLLVGLAHLSSVPSVPVVSLFRARILSCSSAAVSRITRSPRKGSSGGAERGRTCVGASADTAGLPYTAFTASVRASCRAAPRATPSRQAVSFLACALNGAPEAASRPSSAASAVISSTRRCTFPATVAICASSQSRPASARVYGAVTARSAGRGRPGSGHTVRRSSPSTPGHRPTATGTRDSAGHGRSAAPAPGQSGSPRGPRPARRAGWGPPAEAPTPGSGSPGRTPGRAARPAGPGPRAGRPQHRPPCTTGRTASGRRSLAALRPLDSELNARDTEVVR